MTITYVVILTVGIIILLAGLVTWLAWRSHVKQADVKRTNRRLNGGH